MSKLLQKLFSGNIIGKAHGVRLIFFSLLFIILIGFATIKTFFPAFSLFPEQRFPLVIENWQDDHLPFVMSPLKLFTPPSNFCSIEDYGAKGDGVTLNTIAFAEAIADCAKQGGGHVIIPPGKFLTGAIILEDNITLEVQEGAELIFSQNVRDYLPPVFSRYEGMEYYNYSPAIYARDCHDIALTGKGHINGQGEAWWIWKSWQQKGAKKLYALADAEVPVEERVFATPEDGLRPSLIQFVNCERVLVEGVTIENGPMWTLHPLYSREVVIRDITITTQGPNNDGIVLDSSENVLVEHVRLNTEDDAIVIKSGVDKDGKRVGKPSENIIIRDCFVGHGNGGVVIGSEMSGDVRNVLVSRCQFEGTKRGFRVKSAPGRGGVIENIWVENITMKNILAEAIFLNMYYDSKNVVRPTTIDPPLFRNFFFKNITCQGSANGIILTGASDSFIQDVSFENIEMTSQNGSSFYNTTRLTLHNVNIQAKVRPLFTFHNVQEVALTPQSFIPLPPTRPFLRIQGDQSKDIWIDKRFAPSILSKGREVPSTAIQWENL
jgi:hypothetical protein